MTVNVLSRAKRTLLSGGLFWRSIPLRHPVVGRIRAYTSPTSSANPPSSSRKQVTIINDDGRIRWKDLSVREKAARTTQQTFNFGVVLMGLLMTGGVVYLLYTEVFSKDSKIGHFNKAVDRVRTDRRAKEILGSGTTIEAYGEPTLNKWARARPISSKSWKDDKGSEHVVMHFNVKGSLRSGVVNLHTVKKEGENTFQYKYLALDVQGHPMFYLENQDAVKEHVKKPGIKMFGVEWR